MYDRSLDDAIEADRRFGLHGLLARDRRKRLVQDFVEIPAQLRQVDAAARHQLPRLRILDERIQQVLEAHQVVAAIGGHAKRAANALERFRGKRDGGAAHARCSCGSGSIVTSSGNSCCSASRRAAVTLVSATSRV